jgi:predicted DNA-binding transcriptional regulator AlpA
MNMVNAHLKVLSTADVAKKMGLATASVRRFAISGDLKGRKLGARSWVFDEDEVEKFIRRYDKELDPASGGRPRGAKPRKS